MRQATGAKVQQWSWSEGLPAESQGEPPGQVLLTEAELEPDRPLTEQVCIGESCSRCLYSCPADAVLHFGIDKRACATEAQEFGFSTILQFFERFVAMPIEGKRAAITSRDLFGFWQGLLRVVGSFGDCPRCLAVCPVGNDYHAHLSDVQKAIPEKTPEKVALGRSYKDARAATRFRVSTTGTSGGSVPRWSW